MEENRQSLSWKNILPELLTMLFISAGIYGYSFLNEIDMVLTLRNTVMGILGISIVGYMYRQEYLTGLLDYNNSEYPLRFWLAIWGSMVIAFVCVFLPESGWPFVPVFVLLSLFSNMCIGVAAGSVFLMVCVLLTDASAGVFFLYFISGIFAAGLFKNMKNGFAAGIPCFLSMLCLLVCETADIILTANERLSYEQFLIPVANLIICSVLLLGILKLFFGKVIYRYRDFYLEWNDTENSVLTEYKKTDKDAYYICIHTAYFCERIAQKLSLDIDVLKCAGYYHKMEKELDRFTEECHFPKEVVEVLKEYHTSKASVTRKETAILLCADSIISSIGYVISKSNNKPVDYDQVIDTVFKKFQEKGTFRRCNITMQELDTIQMIFKEEKLYYDFLR